MSTIMNIENMSPTFSPLQYFTTHCYKKKSSLVTLSSVSEFVLDLFELIQSF